MGAPGHDPVALTDEPGHHLGLRREAADRRQPVGFRAEEYVRGVDAERRAAHVLASGVACEVVEDSAECWLELEDLDRRAAVHAARVALDDEIGTAVAGDIDAPDLRDPELAGRLHDPAASQDVQARDRPSLARLRRR
jgi:hypothetical protein